MGVSDFMITRLERTSHYISYLDFIDIDCILVLRIYNIVWWCPCVLSWRSWVQRHWSFYTFSICFHWLILDCYYWLLVLILWGCSVVKKSYFWMLSMEKCSFQRWIQFLFTHWTIWTTLQWWKAGHEWRLIIRHYGKLLRRCGLKNCVPIFRLSHSHDFHPLLIIVRLLSSIPLSFNFDYIAITRKFQIDFVQLLLQFEAFHTQDIHIEFSVLLVH